MTDNDYSVVADINGNYLLGPGGGFTLSITALQHIINGDFSERQVRVNNKFSHLEKILTGGLHTADGWLSFKKNRTDLAHGACFISNRDRLWYFARELQNGVILLRIPREMYQSKAARLTKLSDIYYKSGHLWKTLFPMTMTEPEIIAVINEALHNVDKEESTPDILIGYAFPTDPFKAMKVRIQVIGSNINSAFPTWGQPRTGNNGKPYAHSDSIGFYIAESTIFFDDFDKYQNLMEASKLLHNVSGVGDLINSTPSFLLERPTFSQYHRDEDTREEWQAQVDSYGRGMSESEATKLLQQYLMDVLILKDPYGFLLEAYNDNLEEVKAVAGWKNIFALFQNALDGFTALTAFDENAGTDYAAQYALSYLRSRFLRTGGIDLWEAKRFHRTILEMVISRNDPEFAWTYIKELALSPSRVACFTDFDLNPFADLDITVIGVSEPAVKLKPSHFYKFLGENLGLNYLMLLEGNERTELAEKIQKRYCKNSDSLVLELVNMADSSEFISFSYLFNDLGKLLKRFNGKVDEDSLELILHDYYRMQVLANHRIVKDNYFILDQGEKLDFNDTELSAYWFYTKVKHQRDFLVYSTQIFTDHMAELANALGMMELAEESRRLNNTFKKERIPLPRPIPNYIGSWHADFKKITEVKRDAETVFNAMFSDERDIVVFKHESIHQGQLRR